MPVRNEIAHFCLMPYNHVTMNSEQVKGTLLQLRPTDEYFEVVLSGKKSRKVDGLYKPESREIILHSGNFHSDNEMMYTAIHEYAHHLQFSSSTMLISVRSHTVEFWSLFHSLLYEAEKTGLYTNPFDAIDEFVELTRSIKEQFLMVNGELMKDLGGLLKEAQRLCGKYHTSFTDYLDRVLAIPKTSAAVMMKTEAMDLDSRIGFENMRVLTRIGDPETRKEAEGILLQGGSPDMLRQRFLSRSPAGDPLERMSQEKLSIEKQIRRLKGKMTDLDRRIEEYKRKSTSSGADDPNQARVIDFPTKGGLKPRG